MTIKNYLDEERIHYSIKLKRDGQSKYVQLWEHIDGMNKKHKNEFAIIYTWRADIIKKFLDRLISHYVENFKKETLRSENLKNKHLIDIDKSEWGNRYKLTSEIAMRIFFGMKLISSMDKRPRIEEALEKLYHLTDEEISFWSWKVLSLENKALSGFKSMYL